MTPENSGPEQVRDNNGRWRPGHSGNAAGKPRGTRHKATKAAQALLAGEAERITQQAINLALAGDIAAIRLVLERIIPKQRERPMDFDLGSVNSAADVVGALGRIREGVADGDLTASEANAMIELLNTTLSAIEVAELEARIAQMERHLESTGKFEAARIRD